MIQPEFKAEWDKEVARCEIIFLADHGGGYPDVLAGSGLDAEDRLNILRGLGYRVSEHYEMPGIGPDAHKMWPWVRLTNDVAVCLQDGIVSRHRDKRVKRKGGQSHGGKSNQAGEVERLLHAVP